MVQVYTDANVDQSFIVEIVVSQPTQYLNLTCNVTEMEFVKSIL